MKLIVLAVLVLVAVALAAPQVEKQVPKIIRSEYDQQVNGGYNYNYETEDGVQKSETGETKTVNDEENKPHDVVVVRGSYSYTDPEGKLHSVTYIADETGFHAEGDDIAKPQ